MTNIFDRMAAGEQASNSSRAMDDHEVDQATPIEDSPLGLPLNASAPRTPADVRLAVQELLKHGYLEEASRAELFRRTAVHADMIGQVLEPLDLMLRIDTHRGVAFLVVRDEPASEGIDDDGWSHPLIRRQRLTLEQSLLIAILRQAFVIHEQEAGVGQSAATISIDHLLPHFLTYFGDTGSDAKNESRLLQLLDQLKTYGIVSEVDKKQEVTIRPLIAHLANPASLTALLAVLQQQQQSVDSAAERPE